MQKAVRDKVTYNRCVLDNILWFHLECPKRFDRYNEEGFVRSKVKSFYEFQKYQLEKNYEEHKDAHHAHMHTAYAHDIEYNPAIEPSDNADYKKGTAYYWRFVKEKTKYDAETFLRTLSYPMPGDIADMNPMESNFNEDWSNLKSF